MRSRLTYSLGLVFVLLFLLTNCERNNIQKTEENDNAYCDSLEAAGIIDDYTFPVLPGTDEWEQLSREQRDSVLQIPEDTLQQMCTHGLIETCFNYPFLHHYRLYDHFSDWWLMLNFDFNGIPALLERPDAPKKMLKEYLEFNEYPYADSIPNDIKIKRIASKITFMEFFLAQEEILGTFTDDELVLLGEKAKDMWQLKNEYYHIEFSISPTYSCYLLGRMMYFDNYGPLMLELSSNDDLKSFIISGSNILYYYNAYEFIMDNIDDYLLQLKSK